MITEKKLLEEIINLLNSNEAVRTRYDAIREKFKQQLVQANLDKYRLGVMGVTSSGKSTMINAIMKKELLSMAVRPSSSQLVSCSKSNKNQVTIYFEDKAPVIETGKNMSEIIKKYSDEKYNPDNRMKVKQLELSTPIFSLPDEVLLVDSPGLDAYGFAGHEKLTMNSLLPTIDFCLFVTTCKANSDEKMKSVLDTIAEYNCPLIIVQNMIDAIKPSPDGKKSIQQVAEEHRMRIERIVKASAIKDKKSVKIVQISAKWALDSYVSKLKTPQQRRTMLVKSNFEGLIGAINNIFSEIRPKIEYSRITRIRQELQIIIDDAKKDLKYSENERKNILFQYAGYDKKIEASYTKAQKNLADIIKQLEKDKESYQSRTSDFTDSIISSIKSSVKKAEVDLISITKLFYEDISRYCNEFHVDARRLRILESFGATPGLEISTKRVKKRTQKSGFFRGKVARFFGGLFGQEKWGYDEELDDKYDHAKTKKNVEKYYESIISVYSSACENWENSAKAQIDVLFDQYNIQVEAYEARREYLLSESDTEKVILQLEKLIAQIPDKSKRTNEKNVEIAKPVLESDKKLMSINQETDALIKLSKKCLNEIHQKVFSIFTEWDTTKVTLIISWDENSCERFLRSSLGFSNTKLKEKDIGHNICLLKPYQKNNKQEIKKYEKDKYVFIIFNTLQYGSALSNVSESGILNELQKNDKVFFVIQDFEELIIADGVQEGIQNMLQIKDDLRMKNSYRILLNHSNPVYNLIMAEVQMNPCVTHADEVNLIGTIQKRFPYLRSSETDIIISIIIESLRKG